MKLIPESLGHEKLWKQGVLHRDISAGNILLGVEAAEEGKEGFITDWEFAHHRQIRQTRVGTNEDSTETITKTWSDSPRGSLMIVGASLNAVSDYHK